QNDGHYNQQFNQGKALRLNSIRSLTNLASAVHRVLEIFSAIALGSLVTAERKDWAYTSTQKRQNLTTTYLHVHSHSEISFRSSHALSFSRANETNEMQRFSKRGRRRVRALLCLTIYVSSADTFWHRRSWLK